MNLSDLNLSPEETLLLKLSRLSFSPDQKAEISELLEQVKDWSHFSWLANEHGIAALICSNLKELGHLKWLPEKESSFLRSAYLNSLSRNTLLLDKLNQVQEVLAEIGIKPVLLKGIGLELTVYGNMGLRQMNDIDLYIEKDSCLKAWEYLIKKGYQSKPLKSGLYKTLIMDIGKHLPELYKDGIPFELHHKIFNFNEAKILNLQHFTNLTIDGVEYCMLPIEAHYLYLIKHLIYHEMENGDSQIRLYNDLCQVMMQCTRDINNSGILELAKDQGLEQILFEKFYILNKFWGMSLPSEIEEALTQEDRSLVIDTFLKFLRKPKGQALKRRGNTYRSKLKSIPGFYKKALFLTGDLFPSFNYMKTRYNLNWKLLSILFYPLRFGKLLLLIIP